MNPIPVIQQLRSQGLSNNQIVQSLQQQGYNSQQIYEALQMADLRQQIPATPNMPPPANPMQMQPQSTQSGEDVEELIEAVIEEKWNDLKRSVDKIINWKDKTEQKVAAMQQQMDDLKHQFDTLHQAVIGKVGEYDKNVLEVGTQLKAMEKVFSKVLPTFTENVNELNNIVERFKQ